MKIAAAMQDPHTADTAGVSRYRVHGVSVEYPTADGPLPVLEDISFELEAGEVLAIVGRSGTGKTTLLRVLGGLLKPNAGAVELDGMPVTEPPGTVVTVFQDYGNALLPWRTVARNVALGLERGTPRRERDAMVADALEMVGLDHRRSAYPGQLSGGMQQRVQIARALAGDPRVLLMDEPFGALDAMTKASLQDQLLSVKDRSGATVVFITHDLEEAIYLSDRVLVISGGPGRITHAVETNLPQERDQVATRELPRYLELRHDLAEALKLGGREE